MTDLAACTIVPKREIAAARVLADSFRSHHASGRVFVLLSDRLDGYFAPDREPFELIELSDLGLDDLAGLCFQYCLPELRAVLQPPLLGYLLLKRGVSKLLYLSPGTLVLGALEELAGLLDRHSVLLIPELTEVGHVDAEGREEQALLGAGVYSLGLIGLRRDAHAQRVLDWWSRRVRAVRVADTETEVASQAWMALVPALFEGVRVVREPAYSVPASSLRVRRVEIRGDDLRIDGRPAYLLRADDVADRLPSAAATSVVVRYEKLLMGAGHAESRDWPYAFGQFDNGVPIPFEARRLYRDLGEGAARLGDPFQTGHAECFWEWLKQEVHPGSGISRFWHRVYVNRPDLRRLFSDAFEADRLGFLTWIREYGYREHPVGEAFDRSDHVRTADPSREGGQRGPAPSRPGLNLIGYVMSEKGLGEALRATARALTAAEIPHCVVDFPDPGSANIDRSLIGVLEHNPYPINVIHVTADQLPHLVGTRGTRFLQGKYNIGFWMWELPEFPRGFHGSFAYVDEVWVASNYCLDVISRAAPVPVVKIPLALPAEGLRTKGVARDYFGLTEGSLVFLFIFDVHSTLARKNPGGAIEAFKRAFKNAEDVCLVLKLVHGDRRTRRELREQAQDDRLIVMDRVLSRTELNSLIELSDCYVSLHRSEGFGLTMAEAMALGKPVIATAYSANLDFMTPTNSLLVRHDLVRIEEDHGLYRRGSMWAEPDIDHAVELMRWVYEKREAARALGQCAARDIRDYLAPGAVGERIRRRLETIGVRLRAGDFGRLLGR